MVVETSSGRPYTQYELMNGDVLRSFDIHSNPMDYIWHMDSEDRYVYIEQTGQGWKFQFDNELPRLLNKGDKLFIPKMTFHRVIKGEDQLVIRIKTV